MLKKAEFVHADLEYHEELVFEAKADFNEAFLDRINNMSRREKKYWTRHLHKLNDERAKQLLEEAEKEKKKRAETNPAPISNRTIMIAHQNFLAQSQACFKNNLAFICLHILSTL